MTKTNYCSYCMGTGKKAVAHDLLLRSPEEQRKYMEHVEASARPCTHCNGTGRIGVSEMTDNTFLQEAAKVLQDAHERWFYLTRGYGAGEKASVHDAELEREVFQGTIGECVAFIDQHIAAVFLRWLLTREPTEQMLKDGRDVLVTREKEFPAVPEYVSGIYRAMNAALLKEIEG